MTYRELFLLIYQSDMPEEIKQHLYNVNATEKLGFSVRFSSELNEILQSGENFSLNSSNPDSKFQTLKDLYLAIQTEEIAEKLNEDFNEVRAYVGHKHFLKHAERRHSVLKRAKNLLSNVDAINDALYASESFDLNPSPQKLRELLASEDEYTLHDNEDFYHPDGLLDFLYSDAFCPAKHLNRNHQRILGYLKLAFSQDEFNRCGFKDVMFVGDLSTEHLRMAIVLQAVLAASIENAYIDEDQDFYKIELLEIIQNEELRVGDLRAAELKGILTQALISMETIISGYHQFLKGHLDELLVTLGQTLAPSRKRLLGENLPKDASPVLDKIYQRLGDIYLASECISKTGAVVSDKLSFPIQYLVSKPELFDGDIHAQDNVVQLDDDFCQSYNRGILHFAGFESDMQHFYNAKLPEAVRLYVSAVIEQSLSEYEKELYDSLGNAHDEVLRSKVDELFKSVSQAVLRALNPIDVERAIAQVKDGDLNLQIVENITAIEKSLAMLGLADPADAERVTKENASQYQLMVENLKLALAEFNGLQDKEAEMRHVLDISHQAIQGDLKSASKRLSDLLFDHDVNVQRNTSLFKIADERIDAVLVLDLPEGPEAAEDALEENLDDEMQALDPSAQEVQVVISVDNLSYDQCKAMLEEQVQSLSQGHPGNAFAQRAKNVLTEVESLHQNNHLPEADLKKVLFDTTNLLKSPTEGAARNFKQHGEHVQKRSNGKMLGGAMLALAGIAIVGLSVAACIFTFGAAAPISILGFTLGASTLGAGLSVAGAVVGAGVVFSGVGLFASGCKRKPLRKAMDEFSDEVLHPQQALSN